MSARTQNLGEGGKSVKSFILASSFLRHRAIGLGGRLAGEISAARCLAALE
jgi:hypothetical protein